MAAALTRVGVLGLGSMGGPMAANLAKAGFEVWGYDPRAEALEAAARWEIRSCASPAEVARASEVVLAIPFDFRQIEQSVFGPDGVLKGLEKPGLLAMMSTVGPDNARELGQRLAAEGHRLVDAPVSGGHEGAKAGALTIMVSGASEDIAACQPAFDAVAERVFNVGDQVGMGQAAKLANQLLVTTHLVATVEALALGSRSGIEAAHLLEIISTCAGDSRIFRSRGKVIADRSFKTGGTINILVKDARLVLEAGRAAGIPLFLASSAGQVLEMAKALGLGDQDDANVARAYESLGDWEIR